MDIIIGAYPIIYKCMTMCILVCLQLGHVTLLLVYGDIKWGRGKGRHCPLTHQRLPSKLHLLFPIPYLVMFHRMISDWGKDKPQVTMVTNALIYGCHGDVTFDHADWMGMYRYICDNSHVS